MKNFSLDVILLAEKVYFVLFKWTIQSYTAILQCSMWFQAEFSFRIAFQNSIVTK